MSSDYEQITQDNIRRRGEEFDDIGRLLSEQLYSERSHFVYELLQNAEDALKRRFRDNPQSNLPCSVQFLLFQDRLEFRHYGQPFNEEDVRAICDVLKGTKSEDINQIGKFGIGFKSVYAFTSSPAIHSGDEHFTIERYIRPRKADQTPIMQYGETIFIFPFNHDQVSPEESFQLISGKLNKIGPRVLLFLNCINEIEWRINGKPEGTYLRGSKKRGVARHVTVIGQNEDQEDGEDWVVFDRPVASAPNTAGTKVEVAFRLIHDEKSDQDKIVKTKESPLVVFFPTREETRFGFLLQGPYRTTPSRDNIPPDDEWNKTLVRETAKLVVETLHELKGMGLLSLSLLGAMPIRLDDFPEGGMFRPIVDSVRKAFKEEPLLIAEDGSFAAAEEAKLARSTDLRDLLISDQLQILYQAEKPLKWLSAEITQDKTPELRTYLMHHLGIEEVTPDAFARRITKSFLEKQSDEWMIRFYAYLSEQEALWRTVGPLRNREFIRLETGEHVKPFRTDGTPICYLLLQGDSEFALVRRNIVLDEGALKFLKKLGLTEPDIVAEVIEKILPKYKVTVVSTVSDKEHGQDISKILRALKTDSQQKKERLVQSLREIPFLKTTNASTRKITYKMPEEIYFRSAELETYFNGNPNAWFLNEVEGKDDWINLGVEDKPRLLAFYPQFSGEEKEKIRGNSRYTREISTVDYMFDGLQCFLNTFEEFKDEKELKEGALIIWNFLLKHLDHNFSDSKFLFFHGEYKWGYYRGEHWAHFRAAWVKVLRDASWLPAPKNGPVKPDEISLEELPDEFRRDENLRKYLGMKSNEVAILAEKIGVKVDDIEFVKQYQKEFQDWKRVILQSSPAFPIRRSKDPGHREGELNENIKDATKKVYNELLRSVRTTRGKIDPSTWLRNQYTNDHGQMVCQICHNEMPFKKRDGKYYFEAVEIGSDSRIEFEELYLALCPVCAAKYKIFIKQERGETEKVKRRIVESEFCDVPINLDKGDERIRFVEVHFNDLKKILDANEKDK